MINHLRRALRWLGEFFDVVEPEPTRLNCGCIREDSVIVGCLACDHATCDHHRSDHACTNAPEGVSR